MIFNGQSRVLRVVQGANRNLSGGRLDSDAETQNRIIAQLAHLSTAQLAHLCTNVTATTRNTAGVAAVHAAFYDREFETVDGSKDVAIALANANMPYSKYGPMIIKADFRFGG